MADPQATRKLLLFTIFFTNLLSLACQVLWSRKLAFLFGSTAGVFSTVLTVFLLGLALGALFGGRAIDRSVRPWRWLGGLVTGLGIYCILSLSLFDLGRAAFLAVFPADLSPLAAASAKFLIVLIVLLPPTFCIGAVFPATVRMLASRQSSVGQDISLVYALDTLGAAVGALIAGFILVPAVGLRASTWTLGLAAAVLGLVLLQRKQPLGTAEAATAGATPTAPLRKRPETGKKKKDEKAGSLPLVPEAPPLEAVWKPWSIPLILAVFFLSGAAALLLETGWNRLFYVLNGTSVYSMSVVLAGFLSGLGLGSAWMKRRIDKVRDPWALVALLYAAIALGGVLVFRSTGFFGRVYLAFFNASSGYYGFQFQVYLLLFVLVAVPAFAMGANFPLVAKICSRAPERRGFSVGQVFFFNTLGGVAGAFLGEFLLLPHWGFQGLLLVTLAIYVAGTAAFLVLSPEPDRARRRRQAVACAVLIALAIGFSPLVMRFAMPFHAVYYHGLRNKTWEMYQQVVDEMKVVWEKQGFYGQVVIADLDDYVLLKHNGKTDASTSPDDNRTQVLMGHLPLLFHPDPKEVLNIGLGGGATLRAIGHHKELTRITQVEIDPLVTEAARTYFADFNDHVFDDPRLHWVTNDGRNYMDASAQSYDVISSVPPNIWVAGVSGLFTQEFYRSAHKHLKPGGILCQWTPLHEFERDDLRIALRTIRSVFRHAYFWASGSDIVILASDSPLRPDPARVARLLTDPKIGADLDQIGIARDGVLPMMAKPDVPPEQLEAFIGKLDTINVDDRPVLEFRTARNLFYFNKK